MRITLTSKNKNTNMVIPSDVSGLLFVSLAAR